MSEVGDAVQVVMLCGRGAMLVGNISLKVAMQIVEKEMKSYGILYARMPDLCGGDARTQYAIASSDAVKMRAMLLDHTVGPNSHIRVGPISETDYMMTGKKADGTDTKEMETLKKSAQETIDTDMKKEKNQMKDKVDAEKEAPKNTKQKSDRKWKKSKGKSKEREGLIYGRPERGAGDRTANLTEQVEKSERNRIFAVSEEIGIQQYSSSGQALRQAEKQIHEAASDVRVRVRDAVATKGEDSVYWISQKPVYENKQFAQFMMPDGIHAIFIRKEDILPFRDTANGKRVAALFRDQSYSMMNMQKVNITAADGTKAIAMFKLPGGSVIAHTSQQPDRSREGLEKKSLSASSLNPKNEQQGSCILKHNVMQPGIMREKVSE